MIYLDHNATSPLRPEAKAAMERAEQEAWANPSSSHAPGRRSRAFLEDRREHLARLLNCRPEEIVFTSGGTESNNLALKGLAETRPPDRDHIVSTLIEHSSVHQPLLWLQGRGISVTFLKPDRHGLIDPADLDHAITPKTFLVSVILANNEIGTVQDLDAIADICRRRGVPLHCDAVQAVGKLPLDLERSGIHLLSASAHKFGGPKGVGFLYRRHGVRLTPLLHGGGQEKSLRSGTESPALVAGMTAALEAALEHLPETSRRLRGLTTTFWRMVKERIPFAELNGHPDRRVPNTLNIRFPGVSGPKIVDALSEQDIFVSPSSACSSASAKPSRILTALGLMPDEAYSSVRFSFGPETSETDLRTVVDALVHAVA